MANEDTPNGRSITERHVWWKYPPREGQRDDELVWGFLQFYDDGTFEFIDERPTDEQIRARTSCRLSTSDGGSITR